MYFETLGQLTRILILSILSFGVAMVSSPFIIRFLQRVKAGKQIRTEGAPIFAKMHQKKAGTPTMGGIIIWGTAILLALIFFVLNKLFDGIWDYFDFVSRPETYLPLFSLLIAALIGLVDDLLGVFKIGPKGGGLKMSHRIILFSIIALVGSLWFFFKLDWNTLNIPLLGELFVGFWYIPIFIFIIVATAFSTNETNGLDGLAEGVLLFAYLSLGVVAFVQGKYDLAVFSAVITGALSAFLWFNIYPARVFMGDTGSMSLGITLGILVMLTDTALLLPFFGFILLVESLSVIIQVLSKKIRKKKIFLSAPIHHHFEAIGWPETQITMRFWILSALFCGLGLIIYFIDMFL
jgi:phospho-N-acetylmuramoyl-pentapeptide-transferase